VAILRDGIEFEELEARPDAELRTEAGAQAEVILDRTPFYAEGGGQIGDRGELRAADGSVLFEVEDTQKPVGGLIVHRGTLRAKLRLGEPLATVVDDERREHTMRNHTGTHILHRALRNVVGERARQAGSLVTPDYLRFDFPFDRGLTESEKQAIEDEVRRVIREDRPVIPAWMPLQAAIDAGADAFFDEKYGEKVRTVRVEGYSHELCGGTHCRATGQIGAFVITGERSIGSGMRRIEALTGAGADRFVRDRLAALERAAELVGAQSIEALPERLLALQEELRETRRRLRAGGGAGLPKPGELASRAEEVAPGIRLVTFAGPFESIDAMKGLAKDVRGALGSGVVALGLDADEPQVFVTVSDDLVGKGIAAGELVRAAVAPLEGKGGGRPEMAQGRGTRRDGLAAALEAVRTALRNGRKPGA
jgi:alanyl-tRNA synthetase